MKNIKFLIITILSLLMAQTATADGTKTDKGVKVTDKNGKVTNHFHVDSIQVYNDTLTVWNNAMGRDENGNKDVIVAYEVHYYKPQNVEVFDTPCDFSLFAGGDEVTKSGITVKLGLNGSVLGTDKKRWCNTYAMPYSKKLVAKDSNNNILDIEWSTEDPLIATVSPDGTVMGHAPGTTKLKATSLAGKTVEINITTVVTSNKHVDDLEVNSFFPKSEGYKRYFNHYYATELGVWNNSKCENFDSSYDKCDLDVNKGLGFSTSDINVAVKFDKNCNLDTHTYITDVIAVYSTEPVDVSIPFTIDGRKYYYASMIGQKKDNTVAENRITDLNNGVGDGSSYIYLAYTKDGYLRPGETEQRYLVSHSAMAFYGGEYKLDKNLSDKVKDNKNFTRLIIGDKSKVKDAISELGADMLNLGSDDEVVKAYTYDPNTQTYSAEPTSALADFQYGTNTNLITMVCTYEPYCPPANRWMGALDDNTPISSMSIPGTHDSSTEKVTSVISNTALTVMETSLAYWLIPPLGLTIDLVALGVGIAAKENAYMGRTQRYGYRDQFRHGVRLFDVRVDGTSSKGNLVHGEGPQKVVTDYTCQKMLTELKQCLTENDSEFIILEVTIESGCDGTAYSPDQVWEDIKNIIGRDRLIKYKKGLALKDCRGKVLVKGLGSDYVTFDARGEMDYYEIHRSIDPNVRKKGFVGDKSGRYSTPLWASSMEKMGNINNTDVAQSTSGAPAVKYKRAAHQLFNYSTLPIDRETWLYTDISGYFFGVDNEPSKVEWVTHGKYDSQQAAYINSRIAHYIKGMNGRPCGIVRMDFAGTNYADQDQTIFGSGHIATTYGYYLCQTVIRNNIIGKEKNAAGKYYTAYTTEKDAAVLTRGSEPVKKGLERTECGWVQLWENGPKFAEFNVGSSIGTYMGMTEYNDTTVGKYYYPQTATVDNMKPSFIPSDITPSKVQEYSQRSDTISVIWGPNWRTPTTLEIKALLNSENTNIEYCDGKSKLYAPGCKLAGYKISGKNAYAGNSIFLPFAGVRNNGGSANVSDLGDMGLYWTRDSVLANKVVLKTPVSSEINTEINYYSDPISSALSLRAVYEKGRGNPKFNNSILEECYYLDDADDLAAFSAFANGQEYNGELYDSHPTAKAKLTHDIDMSDYDGIKKIWTSIGSFRYPYRGHFDGQNHRIKNLHGNAPFNAVGSQHREHEDVPICTIENVIVDSTCVITDYFYTGGVVNCVALPYDKTYTCVKIQNCGNEGEVYNPHTNHGTTTAGILGGAIHYEQAGVYDNIAMKIEDLIEHVDVRISNCYNTGKIYGKEKIKGQYYAGIMGQMPGRVNMYNCWNTGVVQYNAQWGNETQIWAPWGDKEHSNYAYIDNCYSQKPTYEPEEGYGLVLIKNTNKEHIETTSSERYNIESGELCYQLNKNYIHFTDARTAIAKPDTLVWFQQVGDDHPTLYSEGNDTVYCNSFENCIGESITKYQNENSTLDSEYHSYDDNGFCTRESSEPHYLPAEKEGEQYFINNAGNLYWFAQEWNAGRIEETHPKLMLMNDIFVNKDVYVNGELTSKPDTLRKWTPIGTSEKPFKGSIDGRCHIISGLYCVGGDYAGIFGRVDDLSQMEGVGVVDSYFDANIYAGALAGRADNTSLFEKCFANAVVNISAYDGNIKYAGGLIGYCKSAKHEITNCYSLCDVKIARPAVDNKKGPLFGEIGGKGYSECFHNDSNYKDDGCYMSEDAFKLGLVCDKMNQQEGDLFMTQFIGYNDYPYFGGLGVCYVREAKDEWSTIMVPFKLESDNDIQYYTCKEIEGITLYFEEADEVEPNTPCIMRNLNYNPEESQKDTLLIMPPSGSPVVLEEPLRSMETFSWQNPYNSEQRQELAIIGSLKDTDVSDFEGCENYNVCFFSLNRIRTMACAKKEDVKLSAFRSAFLFNLKSDKSLPPQKFQMGKSNPITLDVQQDVIRPSSGNKLTAEY